MARRKLRIDMVAEVEPTLTDAAGEDGAIRGVGATLREARERRGWSIPDVAQQLRIRAPVLEAMEAGRFEKLPNGAYALGFVRSYADFLGLDRDEIARRVKAEAAALNARTELIFPKPISEGRMPSGIVLIVSLALAIGGYGLWYYRSAKVQIEPPRVEAVPQRLAAQAEAPKSPRDAEAATVATTQAPSPAPTISQPPSNQGTGASKPDTSSTPADAPAPPMMTTPAPAAETTPTPAPAAVPPSVASAPAASPRAESAPQVAALPANPVPAGPAANAAAETKANAAKQFGETDGSSRITMKASGDSWVQVRDHAGAVIFSRILRAGDTYAVPNRPGLMLYTGSAGALDITVDGKSTPSIGKVGSTERNVSLDPERLLAGTAVVDTAKPRAPAAKPAAPKEAQPSAPSAEPTSGTNG
jgi:cytoskeleton protein RodZ